jgi:small-conductance mechanosensitive channel
MKDLLENWTGRIQPWLWNSIVIALAIIIGLTIKGIIKMLTSRYKNQQDYSLLRNIVVHIGKTLNFFVPLLILNFMLPLMVFESRLRPFVSHTLEIALIISFSALLISAVKVFEDYVYHTYDLNKPDNLKERKIRTQLQFIRKVMITFIVFVTIATILFSFDNVREIGTELLTGVGVGGIIIGIAAQKSLANFLAGFQIAFTQPIRINDILMVEGEWGHVEDITLTYVVLNIWDQRRLVLPINYFIEKPFQNWTRTSTQLIGVVFLYMDYSAPIDALREELDRLLEKNKLWDKRRKDVQVTNAKESTIEIRVLVSAKDSSDAFELRNYIREKLIKFITDNYPESLPVNRLFINNPKGGSNNADKSKI